MTNKYLASVFALGAVLFGYFLIQFANAKTEGTEKGKAESGLIARITALERLVESQAKLLQEMQVNTRNLSASVDVVKNRVNDAHSRISGLALKADGTKDGPSWDCGKEDRTDANDLYFMYGFRDGTSCNVRNIAYYKRIALTIPEATTNPKAK